MSRITGNEWRNKKGMKPSMFTLFAIGFSLFTWNTHYSLDLLLIAVTVVIKAQSPSWLHLGNL